MWNGKKVQVKCRRTTRENTSDFPTQHHNETVFGGLFIIIHSRPGCSQFQFITALAMTDFISGSLYVFSSRSACSFSRRLKVFRHFSYFDALREEMWWKTVRPPLWGDERLQYLLSIE